MADIKESSVITVNKEGQQLVRLVSSQSEADGWLPTSMATVNEQGETVMAIAGGSLETNTQVITLLAGERQDVLQTEGGVMVVLPAVSNYIHVAPNSTVKLAADGSEGGPNDYILQLEVTVTTPATSSITVTDGEGVEADGAVKDLVIWPAGKAADVYSKVFHYPLRSKTGAWTIKTGAGVSVLVIGVFK